MNADIHACSCRDAFVAFVNDDTPVTKEWLKLLLDEGLKQHDVAGATGLYYLPPSNSARAHIGVLPIQPPSVDSLERFPLLRSSSLSEMVTGNNAFMLSTKACCYRKMYLFKVGGMRAHGAGFYLRPILQRLPRW